MRAPLAYVATRSRSPPSSAHTDWPVALPLRSQHAMSTAESASVKMPPGPELPAARRSLAVMASTCVGSSPTVSRASSSTALLSAGVSAAPKNVRPRPTAPWSVPSSRVTNSRVSVGAGRPTTSGLSAGVRSTRVVTCVIFMGCLLRSCGRLQYTPGPARTRSSQGGLDGPRWPGQQPLEGRARSLGRPAVAADSTVAEPARKGTGELALFADLARQAHDRLDPLPSPRDVARQRRRHVRLAPGGPRQLVGEDGGIFH